MDGDAIFESAYVIHIPDGSARSEMERRLAELDADVVRRASAIVFRVDDNLKSEVMDSDGPNIRKDLTSRVKLPIGLVTYSKQLTAHQLWEVSRDGCTEITIPGVVSFVRRNGLRQLVENASAHCYLTARDTYHFITPSNRHTSLFLRVADSITSTEVLDQYAFWLMPSLALANLILVDNWSIAAIILRTLSCLNSSAHFECFSTHPLYDRHSAEETIDRLLLRRGQEDRLSWVVSVTGSGTVTDLVRVLFRERGVEIDENATTSIFGFENTRTIGTVLCELATTLEHFGPDGDCPYCQNDIPALTIDQHGYYLKAGREISTALSRKVAAKDQRPFLGEAHIETALRIHRSDPNDGRHHAFDVDVRTLLEQSQFQHKLISVARNLPRPDVVLAPDHEPGREMARLLAEELGGHVVIANRINPTTEISLDDQQLLRTARSVLIADDVINSGSRLEAYMDGLRTNFANKEAVSILVGVLRTDSEASFTELRGMLSSPSWEITLKYVEKLFMPRWDQRQCPWCEELRLLTAVMQRLAEPPEWIERRVSGLRGLSPLASPLLLLPETIEPTLGANSFLAPEGSGALSVCFHFASALQHLRKDVDANKRLVPEFPVLRVFGERNLRNYNEPLLRALLLRLVKPSEWGTQNRATMRQRLITCLSDGRHDVLLGEVLLAVYRRVILPFDRRQFNGWFAAKLGDILPVVADIIGIPAEGGLGGNPR